MGRASRTKAESRAQGKPRIVSIYNPRTRLVEQHQVTISDRGLRDWINDRERLVGQGYPDRPPTYDDPKVRFWVDSGQAPEDPRKDADERDAERFVQSWAAGNPVFGTELKMLAFASFDGGFIVRIKLVKADGSAWASDVHIDSWSEVLALAERLTPIWAVLGCLEPVIVTKQEMDAALQSVTRQFGGTERPKAA